MRIFSRITSLASLAAVGLLIAGPANSADIARPVYKAAPPPIATFSWSGLYVGGHAGAAWTDFDSRWDPLPSAAAFTAQTQSHGVSDTAFVGGALIGYNWQFQQWVLGVEGDWSWSGLKGTSSQTWLSTLPGVALDGVTTVEQEVNWLATVRGRLGYLITPQALVYFTGGAAWADIDYRAIARQASNNYDASASLSDTASGYTLGGGLEWAFYGNWLLRAEYLYYNLSSSQSVVAQADLYPGFPSGFSWDDLKIHTVRGGLSYKF